MRGWKREDCVCVSNTPSWFLQKLTWRSGQADREMCAVKGKHRVSIKNLPPCTFCSIFPHMDSRKAGCLSKRRSMWFVFRMSATTSSKCWFPETMTLCSSVVPTASTPCADTTGSVACYKSGFTCSHHTHTQIWTIYCKCSQSNLDNTPFILILF